MNREILFKGKRVDNGEWKEGYLFDNGYSVNKRMFVGGLVIVDYEGTACDEYEINGIDFEEVDPKTISQYTGLKDKNGNKIWGNDIVNCFEAECFGQINWNESEAGFYFEQFLEGGGFDEENIYDYVDCMEVVGNIFDNPELLEGGAEKEGGTDV